MKFLAFIFMLIVPTAPAFAQSSQMGCDPADFPSASAPPKVSVLKGADATSWQPPTGAGWPAQHAKLVVILAGTFRFPGTMNDLLGRIGRVSELRTITYWSAGDGKTVALAKDASALNTPNAKDRRDDFNSSELKVGEHLYYWQDDELTGPTIHELQVHQRDSSHAVVATTNVTSVRKSIFTLFEPGASRSAIVIDRASAGLFHACMVATALEGASGLVTGHQDVYVRREQALFRFLSGSNPLLASLPSQDGSP